MQLPLRIGAAGLGLVALILLAACTGGDSEASTSTTVPALVSPATTEVAGHEIAPLDGCTLISDDDIYAALDLGDNVGIFRFAQGEACTWEPDEPEGVSIHLEPGSPSDFEGGATIADAAAEPVPGLDDVAVWFAGAGSGTLSAGRRTDLGYLFMRLAINRADISDQERRDLATSLLTQAMDTAQFGPPPPVEVDLCELVSDEDAESLLGPHREGRAAARDPLFLIGGGAGLVDLTEPGEHSCSKLILAEIYVNADSGVASDFDEGATLNGISGEPVAGVSDSAVWFEDVPHEGGFAAPHAMDVLSVRVGEARFRIVLALPDMAPEQQFEAAKELAAKSVGKLPGGPGEVVILKPDAPDLSSLSYVDNLTTKVEAGEWTYEEGLVATLKLFSGESSADQVLRNAELFDQSGTGIISLAEEFLETAPDGPSKDEVSHLLDVLVPSFEPEPSEEVAGPITVSLSSFLLASPVAQEEDDGGTGYTIPPEDVGDGFDYPAFPDEPPVAGECANQSPVVPGWDSSGFEMVDVGPWTGAVLFPEEGLEGGWNRETHLLWGLQGLTDSIAEYGTPPVCIRLLFSHHTGSYTFVSQKNKNICGVFINRPMQGRQAGHFRQQLAADIAHCYFPWVFPAQFDVTYQTRRWWNHALAEFLSNTVYPAVDCGSRCDLEWRLSDSMASQETVRPLVSREAANWIFFQAIFNEVGEAGVAAIVRALPGGNDLFAHEQAVADQQEMNEFYHKFSQQLTDAAVEDSGGLFIPYRPEERDISVAKGIYIADPLPFLVTRWHLTVPSGMYACMTAMSSQDVLASYRPGKSGAGTEGGWQEMPEVETPFTDDLVVVVTTVRDGQEFSLQVRDVHEEADCEDQEEEPPPPEPCLCDPSDYFLVWGEIPELIQQIFHPPGQ